MGHWLRRLLRRPPTVRDCIRAAMAAPCEPTKAPDRSGGGGEIVLNELVALGGGASTPEFVPALADETVAADGDVMTDDAEAVVASSDESACVPHTPIISRASIFPTDNSAPPGVLTRLLDALSPSCRAEAIRILRQPLDPERGVVSGPGLVERTRLSRDAHLDRYRDDEGWDFEFGPWVNPHDEDAA